MIIAQPNERGQSVSIFVLMIIVYILISVVSRL